MKQALTILLTLLLLLLPLVGCDLRNIEEIELDSNGNITTAAELAAALAALPFGGGGGNITSAYVEVAADAGANSTAVGNGTLTIAGGTHINTVSDPVTDTITANLSDGDYGDFTMTVGVVTLDANVVADSEIDYTAVTMADFTDDINNTVDTEWDTIGEIEAIILVNVLISSEMDTEGEWEALAGGLNIYTANDNIYIFTIINVPFGTNPVSDSLSDTLNLTSDGNVTITGNAATDTIHFAFANGVTMDIEWDSEGEMEVAWGGANIILEAEIDTLAELEAIMGLINIIQASELDSMAKLEALVGAIDIITAGEIDTEGKLEALLGGLDVFTENDGALDDDDISDDQEGIEDFIGGLINDPDSTQTRIVVTYQDATNSLDFTVTDMSEMVFQTIDTPLGTDPVADSTTDTIIFTAGAGVTITGNAAGDSVTFVATLGTNIDESELDIDNAPTDEFVLTYESDTGKLHWQVETDTQLTQEEVDDYVAALINDPDSVHTVIAIVYDDATDSYDFTVTGTMAEFDTAVTDGNFLWESDFDAKGDLLTATGDDTPSILSVGADGESLTADSSTATGLTWEAKASITTAATTIYVDKDVGGGDGTGVDWANAYVSITAAWDGLPTEVAHTTAIIVRAAATPYREQVTVANKNIAASVTFEAEYYWWGDCEANVGGAGEITDTGAFTDVEVGDHVALLDLNGVSGRGQDYEFCTVDNIANIPDRIGTDGAKTPATGWKYWIVRTEISGSDNGTDGGTARDHCFDIVTTSNISINGFYLTFTDSYAIEAWASQKLYSYALILENTDQGVSTFNNCHYFLYYIGFDSITTSYAGVSSLSGQLYFWWVAADLGNHGFYASNSQLGIDRFYIDNAVTAVFGQYLSTMNVFRGTISNNVTTGVKAQYNSFIRRLNLTNNATTPVSPIGTSEGSYIN